MATWGQGWYTIDGGNIYITVEGGYGSVSRNGSKVSFNWGVRFTTSQWTYNSICARPDGRNWYAMHSHGSIHSNNNETLYATTTADTVAKYTSEATPFWYSGDVPGTGGGEITISTGVSWNGYTPEYSVTTYSFKVPYPAASTYTVSYNANGGSGAPSSQTKYQGYSLTLSSTTPTRAGYRFDGWNTNSSGTGTSYSAGGTYTADSGATLYAKWTALAPIFSAPTVSTDETRIWWSAFTTNIASNIYYKIGSGSWVSLGSNTTTGSAKTLTGQTPGTSYTITFRAENKENTALYTDHAVTVSTYNYPSISSFTAPINAGATQTFSLYNPLGREVTIALTTVGSSTPTTPFATTTVTGTTANFVIPLAAVAQVVTGASSATGTYKLTYSGTVRSTKTGQINIPSSTAPTINESKKTSFFSYKDCATFLFGGTGGASKAMSTFTGSDQRLLQGYSKLQYSLVSANNPFTPQHGASISSYKVKINSKTATAATLGTTYYEGSSAGVTASESAVVVTANNTYTITISATDSRGYTSSYTRTITTYAYAKPSPVITSAYRTDGYGPDAAIALSGSWSPSMNGTNVAKSITAYYREHGTGSYTSKVLYSNSGSATAFQSLAATFNLSGIAFDSNKAYDIYVIAIDGLGQSTTSAVASIALGTPILFVDAEQLGVGINCFPTVAGLEVQGPLKLNGATIMNGETSTTQDFAVAGNLSVGGNTTLNGNVALSSNKRIEKSDAGSWISDRDRALVRQTSNASGNYSPVVGVNTANGYWTIGNLIGNESLIFNYSTDTNYSAATNSTTVVTLGPTGGSIALKDQIYPKDSIYLSYANVSPASFFGGTWEPITGDYYLMVSGSASTNRTGGSNSTSYTPAGSVGGHTLTINEIPAHSHMVTNRTTSYGQGAQSAWRCLSWSGTNHDYWDEVWSANQGGSGSHNHGFTGTAATITINPKYYKVYAWRRTA